MRFSGMAEITIERAKLKDKKWTVMLELLGG